MAITPPTFQSDSDGLIVNKLQISLGAKPLFPALTIQIAPGETLSLMGASGVGKSTLLSAIAGTLDPVFSISGTILLKGENITQMAPQHRRVGLLFQDDLLFPHMTVAENLSFALPQGCTKEEKTQQVHAALCQLEMQGFEKRKPHALSGGQRLRVALMRTLLAKPKALLLDEPFSKLDSKLRVRVRSWVFAHIHQHHIPTLMVSHDVEDVQAANPSRVYQLEPEALANR